MAHHGRRGAVGKNAARLGLVAGLAAHRCPRSGSNALAFAGSVENAVLISMEWSIRPLSSQFVNCDIHIKFFPESDVEDVDIKRLELRHAMRENFFVIGFIVLMFRVYLESKLPTLFVNVITNENTLNLMKRLLNTATL